MIKDLQPACGLPVAFDTDTSELILGEGLNSPSYCVRKLHDLDGVWANPVTDEDRVIYRYTSGLHLPGDEQVWKDANVIFGIVIFAPGTFGGEYVKSSGQFHPPVSPTNQATGVGAPRQTVRTDDAGALAPARTIEVTVTGDHRILDGAEVARFMGTLSESVGERGEIK